MDMQNLHTGSHDSNNECKHAWWCHLSDRSGRPSRVYRWCKSHPLSCEFRLYVCNQGYQHGHRHSTKRACGPLSKAAGICAPLWARYYLDMHGAVPIIMSRYERCLEQCSATRHPRIGMYICRYGHVHRHKC